MAVGGLGVATCSFMLSCIAFYTAQSTRLILLFHLLAYCSAAHLDTASFLARVGAASGTLAIASFSAYFSLKLTVVFALPKAFLIAGSHISDEILLGSFPLT